MATQRIYRTADGRHVQEGHPEAAFLAYSQYDEAPADVRTELDPAKVKPKPADKARTPEANKAQAKPADK